MLDNRSWCEEDEMLHIVESIENGDFEVSNIEIRGDFQVTIEPDHEIWQVRYTDGTLGRETRIDNDDPTFERCKGCDRRWAAQDRNIRYDNTDGRMVCPECRERVLAHSANCICGSCLHKMFIA